MNRLTNRSRNRKKRRKKQKKQNREADEQTNRNRGRDKDRKRSERNDSLQLQEMCDGVKGTLKISFMTNACCPLVKATTGRCRTPAAPTDP